MSKKFSASCNWWAYFWFRSYAVMNCYRPKAHWKRFRAHWIYYMMTTQAIAYLWERERKSFSNQVSRKVSRRRLCSPPSLFRVNSLRPVVFYLWVTKDRHWYHPRASQLIKRWQRPHYIKTPFNLRDFWNSRWWYRIIPKISDSIVIQAAPKHWMYFTFVNGSWNSVRWWSADRSNWQVIDKFSTPNVVESEVWLDIICCVSSPVASWYPIYWQFPYH